MNKLEQKNLVESTIKHSTGKPSRRIYTITSTGRTELSKKLKDVLSINTKPISPFELGIAYIDILEFADVIQCLDKYIESIEMRKERLKKMLQSARESNSNYRITALYERPLELAKAEEKWDEVAITLLPDELSSLKKLREIMIENNKIQEESGETYQKDLSKLDNEMLQALEDAKKEVKNYDPFFEKLKTRIKEAYEIETEAWKVLKQI